MAGLSRIELFTGFCLFSIGTGALMSVAKMAKMDNWGDRASHAAGLTASFMFAFTLAGYLPTGKEMLSQIFSSDSSSPALSGANL